FGNAFLAHSQSEYLRKRIAAGELTAAAYYRELLRLVYRLLFLMVAEEMVALDICAAEGTRLCDCGDFDCPRLARINGLLPVATGDVGVRSVSKCYFICHLSLLRLRAAARSRDSASDDAL